ncbi:CLUMA_CG018388, isoform A [Clunio marinus]|uniref:CLUMA_CG018388, isoform A n=1 Tax=Clunio marinus TaxID=568069 RepID=A0A1J1IY64_9DIPT|nr:CLUMA_CG018388, isoform A [Clunio marinus]
MRRKASPLIFHGNAMQSGRKEVCLAILHVTLSDHCSRTMIVTQLNASHDSLESVLNTTSTHVSNLYLLRENTRKKTVYWRFN